MVPSTWEWPFVRLVADCVCRDNVCRPRSGQSHWKSPWRQSAWELPYTAWRPLPSLPLLRSTLVVDYFAVAPWEDQTTTKVLQQPPWERQFVVPCEKILPVRLLVRRPACRETTVLGPWCCKCSRPKRGAIWVFRGRLDCPLPRFHSVSFHHHCFSSVAATLGEAAAKLFLARECNTAMAFPFALPFLLLLRSYHSLPPAIAYRLRFHHHAGYYYSYQHLRSLSFSKLLRRHLQHSCRSHQCQQHCREAEAVDRESFHHHHHLRLVLRIYHLPVPSTPLPLPCPPT
mmetsp:Transcript_22282/g.61897  ORF Transcript_22282/g.61897 Transcript_22282/m.61897 type:complete len:286 (+) Transcript_22282:5243-6100(+)